MRKTTLRGTAWETNEVSWLVLAPRQPMALELNDLDSRSVIFDDHVDPHPSMLALERCHEK